MSISSTHLTPHTYFATLPGMWERTISCSSLSKTYSITGWRLGYTIAPAEITDRIKKVHDFLTVGAAAPLQEAVIPGLRFGRDYYDELLKTYTHKRDLFVQGLDAIGLEHTTPQGAYYVLMDISALRLQERPGILRDAGPGCGRRRSARLQLLPRGCEPLDPLPFCEEGWNAA